MFPARKKLYLIGSLRNPRVPEIAEAIRKATDFNVFDDWFAAGERADDSLWAYEKARGHNCIEALKNNAAQHVFQYDKKHLEESDVAVLIAPAGKSAHLELGWHLRSGKPGFMLFDNDPERIDIMMNFATGLFLDEKVMIEALKKL